MPLRWKNLITKVKMSLNKEIWWLPSNQVSRPSITNKGQGGGGTIKGQADIMCCLTWYNWTKKLAQPWKNCLAVSKRLDICIPQTQQFRLDRHPTEMNPCVCQDTSKDVHGGLSSQQPQTRSCSNSRQQQKLMNYGIFIRWTLYSRDSPIYNMR